MDVKQIQAELKQIRANISQVIVGKQTTIDLLLIALLSRGHVLLEDIPGIGKTTLVTTLARSLGLTFRRIQFTPDVMPSDITGFSLYNQKTGEFDFRPGVVMSQLLLADEINRTSPKTQSSLLEAMQENQVTVDGITYPVPQPFMVLATQNPIEQVGTYPLPEAQLDRFMLKLTLGYPTVEEEMEIYQRFAGHSPLEELQQVVDAHTVLEMQECVRTIFCSDAVRRYAALLAQATRNHPDVALGVSPRGSLMLLLAARGHAVLNGRDYCLPDDIQAMFWPVLTHRILLKPESRLHRRTVQDVLEEIRRQVLVPVT
jgi:MoxR-like ATPase